MTMGSDGLEKAILKALKAADDSMGLKPLRKSVGNDKKAFKEAWASLLAAARVMEIDGIAVRLSKKRKKQDKHEDTTATRLDGDGGGDGEYGEELHEGAHKEEEAVKGNEGNTHKRKKTESDRAPPAQANPNTGTAGSMYPDLWTTAEQLWRDQNIDQGYLENNPDGITRLFVGNPNPNPNPNPTTHPHPRPNPVSN